MQYFRKVLRRLGWPIVFFALLYVLPALTVADGEETLMGRWKGDWYSYTRLNYVKMELEITSVSPLEGALYKTYEEASKREPFASVKGEIRNGKVFLEFVGSDNAQWNFELALKGKTLEGDGKTWFRGLSHSGWFYANLKLEKSD